MFPTWILFLGEFLFCRAGFLFEEGGAVPEDAAVFFWGRRRFFQKCGVYPCYGKRRLFIKDAAFFLLWKTGKISKDTGILSVECGAFFKDAAFSFCGRRKYFQKIWRISIRRKWRLFSKIRPFPSLEERDNFKRQSLPFPVSSASFSFISMVWVQKIQSFFPVKNKPDKMAYFLLFRRVFRAFWCKF